MAFHDATTGKMDVDFQIPKFKRLANTRSNDAGGTITPLKGRPKTGPLANNFSSRIVNPIRNLPEECKRYFQMVDKKRQWNLRINNDNEIIKEGAPLGQIQQQKKQQQKMLPFGRKGFKTRLWRKSVLSYSITKEFSANSLKRSVSGRRNTSIAEAISYF